MRVSSIHVRALVEGVESVGVSGALLLERSGIDRERLRDTYSWFELAEFEQLLALASELTDDAAFGLHWGESSPMMQFDLVAPLMAQAPSLRACLESVQRFRALFSDHTELALVERQSTAILRFCPSGPSTPARRLRADFYVSGMARLIRYVRPVQGVKRIALQHAAPPYLAEYTRILGELPLFDQPHTEIEIERELLDRPLENRNAELHQLLEKQAQRVSERLLGNLSYSQRISELLRQSSPRRLEMPEVARTLGLSVRSLRRRLLDENVSFTQLVEQVQIERAQELLSAASPSLKEIAHQLDFASVNSFHRAFKRWTGTSPTTFRQSGK